MWFHGRVVGGLILILLGILFLLDSMGMMELHEFFHFGWPLILILVGIYLLSWRGMPGRTWSSFPRGVESRVFGGTRATTSADTLSSSTVFGDLKLAVNSKEFKGGTVSTVFGDTVLDLSEAVVAEGEHRLKIDGVFGDLSIRLAAGTAYRVSATTVFGKTAAAGVHKEGFSNALDVESPGYATSPRRLRIDASQVFGDLTVVTSA